MGGSLEEEPRGRGKKPWNLCFSKRNDKEKYSKRPEENGTYLVSNVHIMAPKMTGVVHLNPIQVLLREGSEALGFRKLEQMSYNRKVEFQEKPLKNGQTFGNRTVSVRIHPTEVLLQLVECELVNGRRAQIVDERLLVDLPRLYNNKFENNKNVASKH